MVPMKLDTGNYVGELDHEHKRMGVGACTWSDGSTYEGDWFKDRRHGLGKHRYPAGDTYEGSWVNGVRHGNGRQTMTNGDTIECTWINDRLNGLALVKKGDNDVHTVIFKEDMKIMANDSGLSWCDYFYILVSIFMMLAFYIVLPMRLIREEDEFTGVFTAAPIIAYLVYVVWSFRHATTKYL